MNGPARPAAPSPWRLARAALTLFLVDPVASVGIRVRARAGPIRDRWVENLLAALPPGVPQRRLPPNADESRIFGGLDLAATLRAGRPVAQPGLLAEAAGGLVLVPMAERMPERLAVRLGAVLDRAQGGVSDWDAADAGGFGLVLFDEGIGEEAPPAGLLDRLAFHVDLGSVVASEIQHDPVDGRAIAAARDRVPAVRVDDDAIAALCKTAVSLGIPSLRAPLLALRVARMSAALAGVDHVRPEDLREAVGLVLAPRAQRPPDSSDAPSDEAPAPPPDPGSPGAPDPPRDRPDDDRDPETGDRSASDDDIQEILLDAARAAIPAGLTGLFQRGRPSRGDQGGSGRAGPSRAGSRGGRMIGARRGVPGSRVRVNLIETLRAAAPWQPVRRRQLADGPEVSADSPLVRIHRDDIRISRFRQRTRTTTIFAVDASGSAALSRLAEAKGAVEYMLAECYVRRDEVALVAFRGESAQLLLPPTRSLARAKRCLQALPGGGGTPLAAGIDAALAAADLAIRKEARPVIVLMTDGRANVARNGGSRDEAAVDAHKAARRVRGAGIPSILIDISARPRPAAETLAREMGAVYVALPHVDALSLSNRVQALSETLR